MNWILQIFVALPLVGFGISLLINEKREKLISRVASFTTGIQLLGLLIYTGFWLARGAQDINMREYTVVHTSDYEFFIDFYFDAVSATYLIVGGLLSFMVSSYSQFYLHREKGYKRFFCTILFFFFGYNLVILSGNFETLFSGWEIIGLSSFLLIAFYRERYMPVKNAFKVFSIYRIGDIGIILAMWASHHLWHENITFMKLNNNQLVSIHLQEHSFIGVFISLALLIAAAIKSAQLPFSSWLPRAMEGPTPSSAIFYGSLSVHLGVFLLLRTSPFWEHQTSVRVMIGLLGLATSVVAHFISRVQSSIKSQVAYASIGQIGIIFIEIAFGFKTLALIHFASNAFLRTYQLLISPSVVNYMIGEQLYSQFKRKKSLEDSLPSKIENTLYALSLREFNLEGFMNVAFWKPLKRLGGIISFVTFKNLFFIFTPIYLLGILAYFYRAEIPSSILKLIPDVFAFLGMLLVFRSFSERSSPFTSWMLLPINHCWIALAIAFNEHVELSELFWYISGVIVSGALGLGLLYLLQKREGNISIARYSGHAYEYQQLSFVFLIAALGLTGFPITSTFFGEDLIFSHIKSDQALLALFVSQSFIIGGIAAIRIYTRLFLGPHIKTYHAIARPSA